MASLRLRRGKYVARIRWYNEDGKRVEKNVPLRTRKRVDAIEKIAEVEKVESDIKRGNRNSC